MGRDRPSVYRVTDPEQIRLMTSAVKLEILDAARVLGKSSVTEMASLVGRTPDALRHHVRELEEVGLLEVCGERETSRRNETLYQTPGVRLRLPHDPSDPELTEMRLKAFGALLRLTERDLRDAFEGGVARVQGPGKNVVNGRIKGWLSRDELREVNALIERILAIVESAEAPDEDDPGARELYAMALYLCPIVARKRER